VSPVGEDGVEGDSSRLPEQRPAVEFVECVSDRRGVDRVDVQGVLGGGVVGTEGIDRRTASQCGEGRRARGSEGAAASEDHTGTGVTSYVGVSMIQSSVSRR